jgi:hypothetical protein
LDAELARTVVLNEIPSTSIFFFLDPQYDSHESLGLLKGLEYRTLRAYGQSLSTIARYPADSVVHSLEAFIPVLQTKLDSLAEELGHPLAINEDVIWDTANEVTTQLGLRARSELMTPLRHALTGRKVSQNGFTRTDMAERTKRADDHGDSGCQAKSGEIRSRIGFREGSVEAATKIAKHCIYMLSLSNLSHVCSSSA